MRISIADDGLKRFLKNPITAYDLECAFRLFRNGRATGPDFIPVELLKYGSELLAQPLQTSLIMDLPQETTSTWATGYFSDSPSQISCLVNALAFYPSFYLTASLRRSLWWCFAASPPRSKNSCPRNKVVSDPVAALLMQCGPTGG